MSLVRSFLLPAIAIAAASAGASPQGGLFDYRPPPGEIVLNTDSTLITPVGGAPFRVVGGVFLFRNVTIDPGVTVRGEGSRPMIWLVVGDFTVNGDLRVDGANGARVDTLNAANFPAPGGPGACSGGDGGAGSPSATSRSATGEPGHGPFNVVGGGGAPGLLSCVLGCGRGSAAGGGSFATVGDPDYLPPGVTPWPQVSGIGGAGCLNKTLAGGAGGPSPFVDGNPGNDFFGVAVDINRGVLVPGELARLQGGAGGGGGGDRAPRCTIADPAFVSDNRGGGGGGGGGALVIAALGRISVGPTGHVTANGGHGGGGEQAGSNNQGGGGAGGSGGAILLLSRRWVELHTHGGTFGNNDFDFAVAADGGIGRQGAFSGIVIDEKYPIGNAGWDTKPAGGFGGLGLVQIFTPIGGNTDGTNTHLDDNIRIIDNGMLLTGARKQAFIAWRGFPDASGTFVDDFGRPTNIGRNAGDIRPTPILVPVF